MRKILISTLLTLLMLVPTAFANNIHQYQLKNGLKIIVKEDHRSPVVVSEVWYKVGSSYEPNGITGISHMLEHMMFKGTKQYPGTSFQQIIAENGGKQNAFTSADYTAYFEEMSKDKLPLIFKLEADRMRNLVLAEKDFTKEQQVVMEERRLRVEDNPQSQTYERFAAAAFIASPYHQPIIGWMNDIRHLTIQDLQQWYQKWYAPNNATLVVVGDVNAEEVYHLAKKYFGPIKPSNNIPTTHEENVKPLGKRQLTVNLPAKLPLLLMGYNTPVLNSIPNSDDAYALAVLAGILDGGDSSRLASQLVRGQQIATSASASYDIFDRLPTLFVLAGIPSQGHSVAQLEKALLQQVHNLQSKPVSQAELDRVKAQVIASHVFAQDSLYYQAMLIGSLESVGLSWKEIDNYTKKIQAVTPQQVQAVAKKYLVTNRLTIAELNPLPISGQQANLANAIGENNVQ